MIEVPARFHSLAQGQVINPVANLYISYTKQPPKPLLPDTFQEVEYIESTGTQYIDTGITPDATKRYVFDTRIQPVSLPSSNNMIFGIGASNSTVPPSGYRFYGVSFRVFNNENRYEIGYGTASKFGTGTARFELGRTDHIVQTLSPSYREIVVNGVSQFVETGAITLPSYNRTLKLPAYDYNGNVNTGYSMRAKVFDLKISVDDAVTHHFVPAVAKARGKNLFEIPSVAITTESGRTKQFAYRLPAGTYTFSYKLDSFELGTNTSFYTNLALYNGNTLLVDTSIGSVTASTQTGVRYSKTFTITQDADGTQNNIRLGQTFYNNGGRISISDIQLEQGSTATSYEPYFEAGEVGLYDIANDLFYINQGTGTFTAGPEVVYEESYFTLDYSRLDGADKLKSSGNNPLQLWDTYEYYNFTDRLVSVDIERSIEFPYDTQSAQADFTLDNTDKYFTPGSGSTISDDNLPRRPVKIYAGFKGETTVPQFVGLTEDMPNVNSERATAEYYAKDFLSEIASMTLTEVVAMRDVTTDLVLAKIVEQFGVLPSQYNFETGDNVIPFVFFDIGQNAGEAIRKLVQAEGGKFWLDEQGILRFRKRYSATTDPVLSLDDYQIISVEPSDTSDIVNRVKINCDLREVQEFQTVYTKSPSGDNVSSTLWVVPAGESITRECRLEDPCYDVITPTLGHATSVSWFTAINVDGVPVTTGVTATGTLSTNAFTVVFTNNNVFPVEIDEMELWGEPAKVYDVLNYDAYEDDSVAQFGEHVLEINDNQFFQSYAQAKSFAVYMLRDRAFYQSILTIRMKGDFSLQLGDVIHLDGEYEGDYKIDACKWHLEAGLLDTEIVVHKFTPLAYFTLDQSQLNGPDLLA